MYFFIEVFTQQSFALFFGAWKKMQAYIISYCIIYVETRMRSQEMLRSSFGLFGS